MLFDVTQIKVALRDSTNILEPDILKGYTCIPSKLVKNSIRSSKGNFCVAAPMKMHDADTPTKCIRIWHDYSLQMVERSEMIARELRKVHLSYFVDYQCFHELLNLSDGRKAPGVIMDWIEEPTLSKFFETNYSNPQLINKAANNFLQLCQDLKRLGMSHGDLSLKNILVGKDGKIMLVDYDSVYVPSMLDNYIQTTGGDSDFQHPDRKRNNQKASKYADSFSELILYLYFRAFILRQDWCQNIKNRLLLTKQDLLSSSSFVNSEGYKMLLALNDREINIVLDEVKRALDLPLSQCGFICDLLNQAIITSNIYATYCGRCGHHFLNQTDVYCPDCGKKRETI